MILKREMMHGYQEKSRLMIKEHNFCALWLDMGLGKTVSSATALQELIDEFEVGRCLIVAPKRVALTTWPMELRNWDHLLPLTFEIIHGNQKERTKALLNRADIHIISRDNLAWLVRMVGKQWPWDMVIIDESSSFKSQSSNRFKALKKVRRYITRMVQLSATPSPQGLVDIWSQFYLLDMGQRLGATEKAYHNRWFIHDRDARKIYPKSKSQEEIYDKIKDITMHMSAEDYLDMPELVYNEIKVEMEPATKAKYDAFERDMIMELEDDEIEASNAATLTGKLLQFANGAVYTDEAKNWSLVHDEKIEALKEIVESHDGTPLLVAYNFKTDLVRLKKAFPQAKVMDDDHKTQIDWNNGKIPILLTHPQSSGHGLNLQRGSNILVWFGLTWSLECYQQLIGRLYRQGQTATSVIVHHILTNGTVDERLIRVMKLKEATQDDLLNAVKSID